MSTETQERIERREAIRAAAYADFIKRIGSGVKFLEALNGVQLQHGLGARSRLELVRRYNKEQGE